MFILSFGLTHGSRSCFLLGQGLGSMAVEVYLEDIELPDLAREAEYARILVDARKEETLAGNGNIWEQTLPDGEVFDLVGGETTAWITYAALLQIRACADRGNAVYLLHYHGEPIWVRFRHEDSPVIMAEPVVPKVRYNSGDYFMNVRLKFMEVSTP